MKRLLLEGDCTTLERSLLASIDLDVPPPRALERVRDAVARSEETVIVPVATPSRVRRLLVNRSTAIGAVLGIAAGIAIMLAARHRPEVAVQKDPSAPVITTAPPVPVPATPGPSETPVESQPAIQTAPLPPAPTAAPSMSVARQPGPSVPPTRSAPPVSIADGIAAAAGPGTAGSGGGGYPRAGSFDKGAAAGALGRVDLSACKAIAGPSGAGHVTVTFNPDGSAGSAVVDQGPYPGTARGGCIAGKFKAAHVPAFDGAPVRVGKSFVISGGGDPPDIY